MIIKEAILENEINKVKEFLKDVGLNYDRDINYTVYIEENDEIIGTISAAQNIIKCFAINPKYQGQNLGNNLISHIINYFHDRSIYYYQVYTKPENVDIFLSFNFNLIASSKNVSLLECRNVTIVETLERVKNNLKLTSEDIASIVVNTNPPTNGHLYLITTASQNHQQVLVFLVEEDRSVFKFKDRYHMLINATKHLSNVKILPSTKYIVSSLTFPTYFLKEDVDEVLEQAEIDAIIFKKYFMTIFGIKKRYVGTETDLVTNKYNQKLKEILGDDLIIIERIKHDGKIISATMIRRLLAEGKIEDVKQYVPQATYEFLTSEEGKKTIQKLQDVYKNG